ncbi:hypothetical protein G4B88_004599 [Cannabis sativa]|uniref:Uncharacterized protein n=1 Tax=Cannabis sativa TaxID=3483 RepID=A0A7J6G5D4_CANSA|nr:hypothetical protein G4B88_004599 [Cannabis sativa]
MHKAKPKTEIYLSFSIPTFANENVIHEILGSRNAPRFLESFSIVSNLQVEIPKETSTYKSLGNLSKDTHPCISKYSNDSNSHISFGKISERVVKLEQPLRSSKLVDSSLIRFFIWIIKNVVKS